MAWEHVMCDMLVCDVWHNNVCVTCEVWLCDVWLMGECVSCDV